jgi:hypothetical protein
MPPGEEEILLVTSLVTVLPAATTLLICTAPTTIAVVAMLETNGGEMGVGPTTMAAVGVIRSTLMVGTTEDSPGVCDPNM